MLTVKAPLEIKAKTSYIRDPESFYYRILGNYSLIQTPVAEEDLLHIAATPPEIYITEGEGISNFLNHSVRNESNYNKVQILNNVLNRIVVSADMNLTYQDRVFITDALYKLGVKDDRKFMNSFYRMAEETRNTNALINLYFEQGQDLKAMVETFSSRTEKEKTTERETIQREPKNFLYNSIFDRLSTGAVYQIVSNFNRSVDYNEIDKNEYSLSAQIYTAQNMLLSVLRERVGLEGKSLTFINQNTFEEAIENMSEDITNVQNQISSAVMMDILQNIYRTGFEKFISSQDLYFRFEDTFYKSSDQVIQRLISSYGTSVSRQDVNEFIFEENNELLRNELRLFGYSQQRNFYEEDVENIENLLQQISINEKNIGNVYEEYQLRRYDTDYDVHPTEKKMLSREVLNVLQILGERQDTETLQVMLQRIGESGGNYESISNIISEYLSSDIYSSYDIRIGGFLKGSKEIYELLQVIASTEDAAEVVNAAKRLKEQENITENFVQVIDDYLMFFSNAERIAAQEETPAGPSAATLEFVELLSGNEEEEPTEEELGRITEIVKKSELYDRSVKERILELATAYKDRGKEVASEGNEDERSAEAVLIQNLTNQNISELSYDSIEQVKKLIISSSEPYGTEMKQRILELTAAGSGAGKGDSQGITGWEEPEAELIRILTDESISELSVQNIEQIKKIVARMPESYDREIKQRILEYIDVAERREKGPVAETTLVQEAAKARLLQILSEENINEITAQNIEQVRNIVAKMPVSYERNVMERVIDLVTASWEEEKNTPSAEPVQDYVRADLIQLLSNENISELSFDNVEQIKEVIRRTSELSTKEKEKLLETVTDSQIRILDEVKAGNEAEREVRQELISILSESKTKTPTEESLERIRTIIRRLEGGTEKYKFIFENEKDHILRERKSAVEKILATKEFENILEQTIEETGKASFEEGKQIQDKSRIRQEIINILESANPEILIENAPSQIREIYSTLQTNIRNIRLAFTQQNYQQAGASQSEFIAQSDKLAAKAPTEIIYESASDEIPSEENESKLIIKREELISLIREYRSEGAPASIEKELQLAIKKEELINLLLDKRSGDKEQVKPENVKTILGQMMISSEKQRAASVPEGKGYEVLKPASEPELIQEENQEEVSLEEVKEQVQKDGAVTDEEIRKLTENINRINVENELRRRQYIEAVRNIHSREPKVTATDAMEKTRKRAIMALESPEVLMETLNNERIVKESREKEILKELQGIFPDQSMEIYQLINRYQSDPDQFLEENIIRPAEVGELLFDLNDATREHPESPEMSVAQLNRENAQEITEDRVRPQMARRPEEATVSRTPAETVHKFTETLSSDELNEQLEMMRHNLTRQIKEEVKSDVVTESHNVNAKEVVTTDNTTQQISQVNIQRMIDNTVRSEMNTISNQVMSKIERQMRNEKIRRGY